MRLEVSNIYGYPSLDNRIKKYAKEIDAILILDRTSLKKLKDLAVSKKVKILIDNPVVFLEQNIPILGFIEHNGIFFKCDFPSKEKLFSNLVKIKIPKDLVRLPAKILVQALTAPCKKSFLHTLDNNSDTYKLVKKLVNSHVSPSLSEKDIKVNKEVSKPKRKKV